MDTVPIIVWVVLGFAGTVALGFICTFGITLVLEAACWLWTWWRK